MMDSIFEKLTWLDKTSNPFGVLCLDCRIFTRSMISTTKDPKVAARFNELRKSTGEQYVGKFPSNMVTVPCILAYPNHGDRKDGPLFLAKVMEDKWDIFLYNSYLYFTRSWTGDLVFRAMISITGSLVDITFIDADAQAASQNPTYIVQQVDFLIKSHLYKHEVPHPLPADLANEIQHIALFSFSQYGRWASFGTYEDTTQIRIT
jgi:hypothetical protein